MRGLCLLLLLSLGLSTAAVHAAKARPAPPQRDKCPICKNIVNKFHEQEARTAKSIHFSGGNPEGWTLEKEKFLGKYAMNEARLVEIMEHVCADTDHTCMDVKTDVEELVEEWWAQEEREDLTQWLCYDRAKLCCPEGRYGKECKKCPGGSSVCGGHGSCNGDGSRVGTGKCQCNHGYAGKDCGKCITGFYLSDNSTCEACHPSCEGGCTGAGPAYCAACKMGFANVSGSCEDIDECKESLFSCPENQYCANTAGSYGCDRCHRACAGGCNGPLSTHCVSCALGFNKTESGSCEDIDECKEGVAHCGLHAYCRNTEGSHECDTCHIACGLNGCTGPSAKDCVACVEGFARNAENACEDVDECATFPCQGAMDCNNTAGAYTCICQPPNVLDNDACTSPPHVPATLPPPASADESEAFRAAYERAETKTAGAVPVLIGESLANTKAVPVSFPPAMFSQPPRVGLLQLKEECCGDKFHLAATAVTSEGFTLLARRTDKQTGWGQQLRAEYYVYAESKAERSEL